MTGDKSQKQRLAAQQTLVEGEQHLVDGKHVIVPPLDEIFDDDIEHAAVAQGKAGPGDKILSLRQIQLQRNGKGDSRGLGGPIARITAYLGEQFPVYVGFFIDLSVLFAAAVDEPEQGLGKAGIQLVQHIAEVPRGLMRECA